MSTYTTHKLDLKCFNSSSSFLQNNDSIKSHTTSVAGKETALVEQSTLNFQFTDSLFFILLILTTIIAFVKISGRQYYQRISTSVISFAYSNSFIREKNLAYNLYNVLLMVVFFISSAMVLITFSDYFKLHHFFESNWLRFLVSFVFLIVFFAFHTFGYYILSVVSEKRVIFKKYIFFLFNVLRIVGTVNVFLLFGAIFSENIIQSVFVFLIVTICIIAYLLRLPRIIFLFSENRFSLYYMILYFCALELIPILLLFKFFSNNLA